MVSSRVYWGGHQAEQAFTLLHGEAQLSGQEVAPGIYMQRRQTAVAEAACGDLTQASGYRPCGLQGMPCLPCSLPPARHRLLAA